MLGVCGGIADYFGFDRNIVRAVTVICCASCSFRRQLSPHTSFLRLVLDVEEPEQKPKALDAVSE